MSYGPVGGLVASALMFGYVARAQADSYTDRRADSNSSATDKGY
jgi:hypothetical protein